MLIVPQAIGLATLAAGAVITFLFTIPVVNWFMPAFATAFMVHVFESTRRPVQLTNR